MAAKRCLSGLIGRSPLHHCSPGQAIARLMPSRLGTGDDEPWICRRVSCPAGRAGTVRTSFRCSVISSRPATARCCCRDVRSSRRSIFVTQRRHRTNNLLRPERSTASFVAAPGRDPTSWREVPTMRNPDRFLDCGGHAVRGAATRPCAGATGRVAGMPSSASSADRPTRAACIRPWRLASRPRELTPRPSACPRLRPTRRLDRAARTRARVRAHRRRRPAPRGKGRPIVTIHRAGE